MFMDNTKARRNHSRRALAHMKRKRMKVWRKTEMRQSNLAPDKWNYLLSERAVIVTPTGVRLRPHVHYNAKSWGNPCSLLVKITRKLLGSYLISSNMGLILARICCMI